MKYQITAKQRHFFEKNGYIEFEELLSKKELDTLWHCYRQDPKKRDLVLRNPKVKEILFSPRFSQIASELSMTRLLRYGFDEVLSSCRFKDECCIQGLEIAMLLYIDPTAAKSANTIFFFPGLCPDIFEQAQTWLVFVWANRDAQYILNQKDPYTHELKKLGYVFGDRLKETTHPVLWR